ncbi:MAG TPA: PadR family transcriptional regulator [Longimicrobiales bacterium]|nr:PadR family transcriptional regulator [Longimicrobiales bacterium]
MVGYQYVEGRGMTVQLKSDLPQGTLDLLILQVISLEPLHGYAIAQRLRQMSREVVQVTQGTLYPALHRLENRGYLTADWKASDTGRDAKFYRLTRKGRAHLQAETASWERLADAISAILRTAKEA